MSISLFAFAIVKEPPQTQLGKRMRVIEGLRRAPAIMRANANYRWFIISRMLTRVGQIAEPFYIIYAIESLGLPAGVAGIYLAVRAISGALSNLLWSRISERRGTRRLILLTGILFVLAPALALAGPMISNTLGLGSAGVLVEGTGFSTKQRMWPAGTGPHDGVMSSGGEAFGAGTASARASAAGQVVAFGPEPKAAVPHGEPRPVGPSKPTPAVQR